MCIELDEHGKTRKNRLAVTDNRNPLKRVIFYAYHSAGKEKRQ